MSRKEPAINRQIVELFGQVIDHYQPDLNHEVISYENCVLVTRTNSGNVESRIVMEIISTLTSLEYVIDQVINFTDGRSVGIAFHYGGPEKF
jgi:hypothetical protein